MNKPMNEKEDCITMVTDSGESVSGENDSEALFEFVEDDRELDGVMGIFEELLKDADVELEK